MEHLPEHQHAYIKDGLVIWVGVFADHDEAHLQEILQHFEADTYICCCNLGYFPSSGDSWDGVSFQTPPEEHPEEYYTWLAEQN